LQASHSAQPLAFKFQIKATPSATDIVIPSPNHPANAAQYLSTPPQPLTLQFETEIEVNTATQKQNLLDHRLGSNAIFANLVSLSPLRRGLGRKALTTAALKTFVATT